MNEESVEIIDIEGIRQEWQSCPFTWGLGDYVTVFTENAGLIILVDIERVGYSNGDSGIRAVPVKASDLTVFEGIDSNE